MQKCAARLCVVLLFAHEPVFHAGPTPYGSYWIARNLTAPSHTDLNIQFHKSTVYSSLGEGPVTNKPEFPGSPASPRLAGAGEQGYRVPTRIGQTPHHHNRLPADNSHEARAKHSEHPRREGERRRSDG